ncbi:MAG: 3-phosphoshikimate 1-carboxyvinyltransferase [bacterium]
MSQLTLTPLPAPVTKTIAISGSKSYTNRALIMAALADGVSRITGYSDSDDSDVLIQGLIKVGIRIEKTTQEIVVHGNGGKFTTKNIAVNLHHAGTSSRFFLALASLIPGEIIVDGSDRLRERPIADLTQALLDLDVKLEFLGKPGCFPIKVFGGNNLGGKVKMRGSVSSQFFTAMLLIAPALKNGIEIEVLGKQISKSYIDMTVGGMQAFKVKVTNQNYKTYSVKPDQKYQACNYHVEGDASGCSYLWAIAALTGSTIKVTNISPESTQGDVKFADLLEQMGCKVVKNVEESWIQITGPTQLQAITTDMELMPDTAQTLAVVAAFAQGITTITGLATLREKETDRLAMPVAELTKMGITAEAGPDWLKITGGNPKTATINTYKDHRMAMSFAVAGSKVSGMIINEPEVVKKSFTNFWEVLTELGIKSNLS